MEAAHNQAMPNFLPGETIITIVIEIPQGPRVFSPRDRDSGGYKDATKFLRFRGCRMIIILIQAVHKDYVKL
jgi:hypothetical protein